MELTRGAKICYNLKKSPYYVDFYTGNGKPTRFYFSSELHRKKFSERLADYNRKIDEMFSKRFGFSLELGLLAAVDLYIKIEKRGFYIKDYHGKGYNFNDFALYGLKVGEKLNV